MFKIWIWATVLGAVAFGLGHASIDHGVRLAIAVFLDASDRQSVEADPLGGATRRVGQSVERTLSDASTYRGYVFAGAASSALLFYMRASRGRRYSRKASALIGVLAAWLVLNVAKLPVWLSRGITDGFDFLLEWVACAAGVATVALAILPLRRFLEVKHERSTPTGVHAR